MQGVELKNSYVKINQLYTLMKITWAGQACFHIVASNSKEHSSTIVIDPFSEIGLKMPSLDAEIVLVSHQHEDHNNVQAIKGTPFVIEGPGEYEVNGVFITGISSFHDEKEGKERGMNTIYTLEAEGMRICHLGDLGQKELTDEQLEKIGAVDILMIPIGGTYTIDGTQAIKVIGQIEPKVVIPMHYALPKLKFKLDEADKFLKSMGKTPQAQDKLTIKQSLLPKEGQTEVVILTP